MYQVEEFRDYFTNKKSTNKSTFNTYNSYLQRIDRAIGGLDEYIALNGADKTIGWGKLNREPPFDSYPSHARSVLKCYLEFKFDAANPTEEIDDEISQDAKLEDTGGLAFKIEKEMQTAIRKQLTNIESGLVEADGGQERRVATGSIDIVARDQNGGLVAIELKAGKCPPGALEQLLGYAEALQDEERSEVRGILIAAEFSDRLLAAAKRTKNTKLLTYEFSLKFSGV